MTLAKDFCDFCTALQIRNPMLVGHSMGATVLTIAQPYMTETSRIILIGTDFSAARFFTEPGSGFRTTPWRPNPFKRKNHWEDCLGKPDLPSIEIFY